MTAVQGPVPVQRDSSPSAPARQARGAERLARLASAAAPLGGRRRPGLPPERWLVTAGAVAMPTGLLLILFGWYGSAQTALPFEQTPYLISGGVLGLALVVGGGFLYFAHWSTVLVREARAERADTQAHHERVEDLLRALVDVASTSREPELELELEPQPAPPVRRRAPARQAEPAARAGASRRRPAGA